MAEGTDAQIAQISFYLAKEDVTFDSIINDEAGLDGSLERKKIFAYSPAEDRVLG